MCDHCFDLLTNECVDCGMSAMNVADPMPGNGATRADMKRWLDARFGPHPKPLESDEAFVRGMIRDAIA